MLLTKMEPRIHVKFNREQAEEQKRMLKFCSDVQRYREAPLVLSDLHVKCVCFCHHLFLSFHFKLKALTEADGRTLSPLQVKEVTFQIRLFSSGQAEIIPSGCSDENFPFIFQDQKVFLIIFYSTRLFCLYFNFLFLSQKMFE